MPIPPMPKKMDNDPCSVIEKISSSQAARRLAEYCREKNLDPRVIATLSPQDLKDLLYRDRSRAVRLPLAQAPRRLGG